MTVSEIERVLNANPTSRVGIHYEAGMGERYVAEIKKELRALIADWRLLTRYVHSRAHDLTGRIYDERAFALLKELKIKEKP